MKPQIIPGDQPNNARVYANQVEPPECVPSPDPVPNAETLAAIEESKDTSAMKRYDSFDAMLKEASLRIRCVPG